MIACADMLAPPVMDLTDRTFGTACDQLAEAVSEYEPDVVVAIATGGVHVAEAMAPKLPSEPVLEHLVLRRPSTGAKERFKAGAVLKRVPAWGANALRWLEVEAREFGLRNEDPSVGAEPMVRASPGLCPEASDTVGSARRLLIVDDTVDSGRTLSAAKEIVLRAGASPSGIRTAVLTSTFRRPPVRPDYCLHDRLLIRFPWSFDT